MVDWLKKKTGLLSNKLVINSPDDLERRTRMVDNLVVYYGPTHINKFKLYQEVARDFLQQDDIEFFHVDSSTL